MRLQPAAALCLLLAVAGCGQKGPLFLPGDPDEGRIVLPDELAGQEQGERTEAPGSERAPAGGNPDEGNDRQDDEQ